MKVLVCKCILHQTLELEVFTLIWEFMETGGSGVSSFNHRHYRVSSFNHRQHCRNFHFLLPLQYPALSDYYKFILVTIMILVSLTELIRLYLGYVGNLLEKVSYQMYTVISAISAFGS